MLCSSHMLCFPGMLCFPHMLFSQYVMLFSYVILYLTLAYLVLKLPKPHYLTSGYLILGHLTLGYLILDYLTSAYLTFGNGTFPHSFLLSHNPLPALSLFPHDITFLNNLSHNASCLTHPLVHCLAPFL